MNKLELLRKDIDILDQQIILLISKRMRVVEKIGVIKRKEKIQFFDKKRLKEILLTRADRGQKLGLSEELVKGIFKLLHKYSVLLQNK